MGTNFNTVPREDSEDPGRNIIIHLVLFDMNHYRIFIALLFAFAVGLFELGAAISNYPLEIRSPRAAGTGIPAIGAKNRIFKAYPGLLYNIRAAVIGGAYPYKHYLTAAPAGMSIDENTGEINWPNPQTSASATIRVVDSNGNEATETWSITVTTAGFHFVDASAPEGGDGSWDNPWNDTLDFMTADKWDNSHAGDFIYFKSGTYFLRGSIEDGNHMAFYDGRKPHVWLAYPGHQPVFDCERTYYLMGGLTDFYLDGLEFKNGANRFITSYGNWTTYRHLRLHDIVDLLNGNNNESLIGNVYGQYLVVQDCLLEDSEGPCGVKMYSVTKGLVEDCVLRDLRNNSEGLAVKGYNVRVSIRNNTLHDIGRAITSNAYQKDGIWCTDNEYLFNLVYNSTAPMEIGGNDYLGLTHVYRNTIIGTPAVYNAFDTQGPVRFTDNVIINAGGGIILKTGTTIADRIVLQGNLTGTAASGIVGASPTYYLAGSHTQYVGQKGYQFGPYNNPPVLTPVSNRSVSAGEQLQFTVQAADADGDALQHTATGN